ncbi:Allophanate hydrolase 2 subunit 1 [Sesbania bispinosa]|nr:Allophanate hydrolase 2 subunit 1 [Sesbania bispinosa]
MGKELEEGIKGCGCVLGEISGGNTSTFVVIEKEYFAPLTGELWDLLTTA